MNHEMEVEIFRAGDYGAKGAWSEDDLDRIAEDYDPKLHEAPVTVDHAQSGPALGWVASLRRTGDRLVANLRGLNGRLWEWIRQGGFKKRSAEIYPALRETSRPYLRAVSFLGAAPPEVKGMSHPVVPEDDAEAALEAVPLFGEDAPDWVAMDAADETAQSRPASPRPAQDASELQTAEAETRMSEEENVVLGKNDLPIAFDEVTDRLRRGGRWQPVWNESGIDAFYEALTKLDAIEIGEEQLVQPAHWFAEFLESLSPVVTMSETAPATGATPDDNIPQGSAVDAASVERHRAVVAFMEAHPGTVYAEALSRCANSAS